MSLVLSPKATRRRSRRRFRVFAIAVLVLCSVVELRDVATAVHAYASAPPKPASPAEFAKNPHAYPKLYRQDGDSRTGKIVPTMPSTGAPIAVRGAVPTLVPGVAPPPAFPSSSYYVLYNQLEDPNHHDLGQEGGFAFNDYEGSMTNLLVGAPCSSTTIAAYGASCATPLSDDEVAYEVEWWLYGYVSNTNGGTGYHDNDGTVNLVISINNSMTANNGSDFYGALARQTYQYASYLNYLDAQSGHSDQLIIWAGDDLETPWNSPAVSLPELASYNTAEQAGVAHLGMVDTGAMYNSCSAASCWDTPLDHGWSMHQIYDANWGGPDGAYSVDVSGPQIDSSTSAAFYANLDSAASAVGDPVPNYPEILYGCNVGTETNAYTAYGDFLQTTGKLPTYMSDLHAVGDPSKESCSVPVFLPG